MHSFHKIKLLLNSPAQISALVLNVESYPDFVPWCQSTKIISRDENEIIAEMEINYKGFAEKYKSSITERKIQNDFIVEVRAITGPFKFLNNKWKISPEEEGCKVDFLIELEFQSFLLDKMMGLFFITATEKMIDAFEVRAKLIYSSI